MIDRDRVLNNFLEMVKIPSPSKNEREIGNYLKKSLEELGAEVIEDCAGDICGGNCGNIIGFFKGELEGTLLFSSHMDTVLPCEKIEPIIENGVIKTDGNSVLGGDDKGGIAAILEMLRYIKEEKIKHKSIVVIFSICEEIGLLGSKNLDIEKYNIDKAFVLDSSGKPGKVIIQAPSAAKGILKIIGKPAHAGLAPEEGINALLVASSAITKIRLGRVDDETTSNIGKITGGKSSNIVLPEVSMLYEARSLSKEKLDNLLKETKEIFNETAKEFRAKFEENIKIEYPGFKLAEESEIVKLVEKACKKAKVEFVATSSGGGSDTNIYNSKGIPAVNMAVGMTKVHTIEEFIKLDDIIDLTKILIEIIKD